MTSRPRKLRSAVRAGAIIAATAFVAYGCFGAQPEPAQPGPSGALINAIHIKADPVPLEPNNPSDVKVGKLTYLAGYELTADDSRFGGLSSLVISPDGADLIALSDRGYWISMKLTHDGEKLTGIGAATLGVLGSQFPGGLTKADADSESLTQDQDGSYLVGFEERHRIWRYPANPERPGPEALSGHPVDVPMPYLLQRAKDNESLESLAVLPDGQIFTALESPIPGETENHAWLVDKDGQAKDLFYDAKDDYSPTDFAVLPDGDVMVVERYFKPLFDIRARFRILKRADIVPGAHLNGELIAGIKAPLTVDNMEGLAVRKASDGSTLIYVVSDDNYSPFQRTLLMEFRLEK